MERNINFLSLLLRGLVVLTATQSIFISAVKIQKVGHIIKASSNCLKESKNMTSSGKLVKEGVGGVSDFHFSHLHYRYPRYAAVNYTKRIIFNKIHFSREQC